MRWNDNNLETAAARTLSPEQRDKIRDAAYLEASDSELAEAAAAQLATLGAGSPLAEAAVPYIDAMKVADIVCLVDTLEISSPCCSGQRFKIRSRGRLIGAGSPGEEVEETQTTVCPSCRRTYDITVVSVCRDENTVSREIEFTVRSETFTYHASGRHTRGSYSGQSFWRPRADGTPVVPPRRIAVEV